MAKTRNSRNLSERYGVERGQYHRPGTTQWANNPSPKTFEKRLADAANKDWDTREQQQAFDLALRDEEFRKGLDGKTRRFVENYNKGKNHDKGMSGIRTIDDVRTIHDFGELWHKHESGNGGKYTSVSDFAGATSHMDDRMRKFHDRNFATKDDLENLTPDEAEEDKGPDRLPSFNEYAGSVGLNTSDEYNPVPDDNFIKSTAAQEMLSDKLSALANDPDKIEKQKQKLNSFAAMDLDSDVFMSSLS